MCVQLHVRVHAARTPVHIRALKVISTFSHAHIHTDLVDHAVYMRFTLYNFLKTFGFFT